MKKKISHKALIGAKLLCIIFNKVDDFLKCFDGNKCLVLFGPEEYDAIFDSIRYFTKLNSSVW